jgi:hypothetical protein
MASIRRRLRAQRSESGATIIIALLFMTVGALLATALASSAGNNLLNTSNLRVQRNFEYAADGALDAAIQASRYHFPPATPPQPCANFTAPAINGYYAFVQCNGTPMEVQTTNGSKTLSPSPSATSPVFVPQDTNLQVTGSCIPFGTQPVSFVSPTQLTMPNPATCATTGGGSNPTIVGGFQTRTVLFWACVSSSPISSCSATNAVATAIVTYSDTDNTGNPQIGFNANVQSWVVNTADH